MTRPRNQLQKVVLCITEDWFAVSHLLPLIEVLQNVSEEVTIVTNCSKHQDALEELGAKVINFDYHRSEIGPIGNLVRALKLSKILKAEKPTAVHFVSIKPVILGAFATFVLKVPARIFHTTGLGYLATSNTIGATLARKFSFFILGRNLQRPSGWLLAENPDDLKFLKAHNVAPRNQAVVVGGAGIDPSAYSPIEHSKTDNELISVTIASRMIKSKGIEDLVKAHQLLGHQGTDFFLELFGDVDEGNPESLSHRELEYWAKQRNIRWHGHVNNPDKIWGQADVAVVASRDREGLPRSMLEAAAHACPLVVTDIPGCRHFVRDHIEGLVVPPNSPESLAQAIHELLQDKKKRRKFGEAARQRVTDAHTVEHIQRTLHGVYDQIKHKQENFL